MNRVIWMTGLPNAGKSTLAQGIQRALPRTIVLDGDVMYQTISKGLSHDEEGRRENTQRTALLANALYEQGFNVVVPTCCPFEDLRNLARQIVGPPFLLMWAFCPIQVCRNRDRCGMYLAAEQGLIDNYPGVHGFDVPRNADLVIHTGYLGASEAVCEAMKSLEPYLTPSVASTSA